MAVLKGMLWSHGPMVVNHGPRLYFTKSVYANRKPTLPYTRSLIMHHLAVQADVRERLRREGARVHEDTRFDVGAARPLANLRHVMCGKVPRAPAHGRAGVGRGRGRGRSGRAGSGAATRRSAGRDG